MTSSFSVCDVIETCVSSDVSTSTVNHWPTAENTYVLTTTVQLKARFSSANMFMFVKKSDFRYLFVFNLERVCVYV